VEIVGRRRRVAGRLLDIDLLDHLIVGHDAFVSLRDRGVSFDRPERRVG
jgi:DNA repair protein RadC